MQTSSQFIPQFAASGVEFLVLLLFMAVSALVSWLQKKKQQETEWREVETPPKPGAPPVKPKPRRVDWEEELRRMLEGDDLEKPEKPAPPPRPIRESSPPVIPTAPQPAASPAPIPKVVGLPRNYKAHCEHCGAHIEFASNMLGEVVICPQCYQQTTLHPFADTRVEQTQHRTELASFKESSSGFERASHLAEVVAGKLQDAVNHPVKIPTVTAQAAPSVEIQQVVSMLRQPRTARQAIIASVILAPPKAMEG